MTAKEQFRPIGDMSLMAPASHRGEVNANVRASLHRPHKHLDQAMDYLRQDASGKSIALVGGGPSIQGFVDELVKFNGDVLVCGTVHDWARKNCIGASHYMIGDHHPIICDHLSLPSRMAIYFVACQSDQRVFDILESSLVVLWHCAWPGQNAAFTPEQWAKLSAMQIDGGCTVGLRALSLARMIGYRDIHFYGFDGCLGDAGDEYAYEQGPNPTAGPADPVTEIRLGRDRPGDKVYRCKGWQIAQARDFAEVFKTCDFRPTFHGGGLISDMWDEIKVNKARVAVDRSIALRRTLLGSGSHFH